MSFLIIIHCKTYSNFETFVCQFFFSTAKADSFRSYSNTKLSSLRWYIFCSFQSKSKCEEILPKINEATAMELALV